MNHGVIRISFVRESTRAKLSIVRSTYEFTTLTLFLSTKWKREQPTIYSRNKTGIKFSAAYTRSEFGYFLDCWLQDCLNTAPTLFPLITAVLCWKSIWPASRRQTIAKTNDNHDFLHPKAFFYKTHAFNHAFINPTDNLTTPPEKSILPHSQQIY